MKVYIILSILLVCFTGCTNTKVEKPENIPDRFKLFMDSYFSAYKYAYEDINPRGNHNYGQQYALFEINKNDLKENKMKKIYNKLINDGWRVIESNNKNYISFCYGENLHLVILFPLIENEVTLSGAPIYYDDINAWNIFIYNSTTKIAECNQNSNDFIDFTKL